MTASAVDARAEVRRWLEADAAAVRAHVARYGHEAIAAAAALTTRLDAIAGDGGAAAAVAELRQLVEDVHAPPPRRRFGVLVTPPPLERRLADAAPLMAAVLDRLAIAGEQLARSVADARAVDRRLAEAAASIEALAERLAALEGAIGAAARELRLEDPVRAAFLRDEVPPLLAERLADARTQQLVLDQGRLSLRLLIEGHEALSLAVDRARHQTVPALRTSVAAARALADAGAARASAAALDARATVAEGVRRMREALGAPDA